MDSGDGRKIGQFSGVVMASQQISTRGEEGRESG